MLKKPKKLVFLLIVIGMLASGIRCTKSHRIGEDDVDSGETDADSEPFAFFDTATSDADTDSDADADADADTDADTDTEGFDCYGMVDTYTVPAPPGDPNANLTALCDTAASVVGNNLAATVTLMPDAEDRKEAVGKIVVSDEIADDVVGLPAVEVRVIQSYSDNEIILTGVDMASSPDGYTFRLVFPDTIDLEPGTVELTVETTLAIGCGDAGDTVKEISALTYIHLCEDIAGTPGWVASGGECRVCFQICEKIAPPLPSLGATGPSALSGSPKAKIVPVALMGRKLILFAEPKGTIGPVSYLWKVSGGEMVGADQAGIIWDIPPSPGPHLVQVAVMDTNSATVTSMRWRHGV